MNLLHKIDDLLNRMARPFYEANTITTYARLGYWWFGSIYLGLLILALWAIGVVRNIWDLAPVPIRRLLAGPFGQYGLESLLEALPFIIIPILIFVALGFITRVSNFLGEAFANFAFKVTHLAISVGEYCIEHRRFSSVLIIGLFSALVVGSYYSYDRYSTRHAEKKEFEHWLSGVEAFIEESPFVRAEAKKYDHIESEWNNKKGFVNTLDGPGGYDHPARCLKDITHVLYGEKSSLPFIDLMGLKSEEVKKIKEECRARPVEDMDSFELRSWALLNLLIGRIYYRMSENCTDCGRLVVAAQHFKEIKPERFNVPDDADRYHSTMHNALGNVYANALSAYLKNEQPGLKEVCESAPNCLMMAWREYDLAGKRKSGEQFPACSFQLKRKLNNVTDMLLRIGVSHERWRGNAIPEINVVIRTPSQLAKELRKRVGELMQCNGDDPFISSAFVTVAQAYATIVALKLKAQEDPSEDIVHTAAYLRLAYSFEPDGLLDAELPYFCSLISSPELEQKFRQALLANLSGLPEVDAEGLILRVRNMRCQ